MGDSIRVDESALADLKSAIGTAGESYKSNLLKLNSLIDEITRKDIQGQPAKDLLDRFNAKKDTFDKLAQTIDDAESYMGIKKTKFTDMIGSLSSNMK
jgi:hypothetical protein